jgi:hypothetical protein
MSKICRTFAARKDTIMKKRTYIQPEMSINMIASDTFVMLQPSNSNVEPNFAPKHYAPASVHRTPVF